MALAAGRVAAIAMIAQHLFDVIRCFGIAPGVQRCFVSLQGVMQAMGLSLDQVGMALPACFAGILARISDEIRMGDIFFRVIHAGMTVDASNFAVDCGTESFPIQ